MSPETATAVLVAWRKVARKGDPKRLRTYTSENLESIARACQEKPAFLAFCINGAAETTMFCELVERTATQRLGCVKWIAPETSPLLVDGSGVALGHAAETVEVGSNPAEGAKPVPSNGETSKGLEPK